MKNNSCGICFLEKYSRRKNIFLVVLALYIYKRSVWVVDLVVLKCHRTISTQKLKLLDKVSIYDLYYSLTHPLK